MPYILSPLICEKLPGLWSEGSPYEREVIYEINGSFPPVNYQKHIFKSHSVTHAEGSLHTKNNGRSIDDYFQGNYFFGTATLVRLPGNGYRAIDETKRIFHWEVSLEELKEALKGRVPQKLILTSESYFKSKSGFHDPNYVLTLSIEAAKWLVSNDGFNLFGTSWKSSDFKPGSMDRPIHNLLFKNAVILECLDLEFVPGGEYFLVAFPVRIKGASESPVTPVLFTKTEVSVFFKDI